MARSSHLPGYFATSQVAGLVPGVVGAAGSGRANVAAEFATDWDPGEDGRLEVAVQGPVVLPGNYGKRIIKMRPQR